MKKALIIGGGFAGCAAAHQFMLKGGWDTTIVERGPSLGAGNRTMFKGGHPCTFGPRHFLTQKPELFEFLNKYVPMRRCADHQFLTYVEDDEQFYNYPIHLDDVDRMPEAQKIKQELASVQKIILDEVDISKDEIEHSNLLGPRGATNLEEFWERSVGKTLYKKFIDQYSKKMWMVNDNKDIDDFAWSPKGVALKEGPKAAWDTAISAYPYALNGYDDYFDISTSEANVLLNTKIDDFDILNKTVWFDEERHTYDVIVNTISPDVLFDNCFGELKFLGRDIEYSILPIKNALPENVYFAYYAGSESFTRIVEYKKFTGYESENTLISKEYVSYNGKHYPMPFKSEIGKAKQYFDLMPEGVFSIGRAGTYKYGYDIDNTIESAFEIAVSL